MALNKRVKQGGSYYKGYELVVPATGGNYVLDMKELSSAAVNSISMTPDNYGAGDKFQLEHLNSSTTRTLVMMAKDIYNPGANISTMFDFPALEMMDAGDVLRFTYVNAAGSAINMHLVVEYVGITKTS